MKDPHSINALHANNNVEEQAAYWFARLRADNASKGDQRRFKSWLEESPRHAEAYALQEEVWAAMQDSAVDDDILAMRQNALGMSATSNDNRWLKYGAIAASLLVAAVSLIVLNPFGYLDGSDFSDPAEQLAQSEPQSSPIYKTAVGQRSTVNLPDGSVVELNTDSLIQINFSDDKRDLILLRGEALFDVAKDESRPFVVEADGKLITAIGTTFSVRRADDEIRVTLIEGIVTVDKEDSEGGNPDAVNKKQLRPGEQLVALGDQPFKVNAINTDAATSWKDGRLIFDNEPLGTIIQEVNRYSTRKLVVGDPTLSDMRVSGIFQVGSVDSFAAALEASFPVAHNAQSDKDDIVLSWKE
ncbi:FecR family protein [Parasphingorhabdus cellanae]|uniref:FecR family protein n=1 Tax=Parasphingorhabdus cellanae TaxID=2806553 RepID=A0ABX7T514_9SPHN|nr:FecR family protein [Parasphingorhabdus cellanae]QTD55895.1 FecR family protein [Parasphingorhabdus cellanae]